MRGVCLAILALPLAGCLTHRAEVGAVPPTGCELTAGRSAVLGQVADGAPQAHESGPLPFDIPASWSLRDADGHLVIGHARALSPLPWWQRFPADLLVDLWPGEVVVATSASVTPVAVRQRTADEITAAARAHGYAP